MAERLEKLAMETLDFIVKEWNIDLSQESPIMVARGRHKDVPKLFAKLGFKKGAEVGVYQGDYSRKLLKRIPGLKLYGIDIWKKYGAYRDFGEATLGAAYALAEKNTEGYDCELIRGWSHEVVEQFEDESLDFVFVDGNHAYEYVVQDIALWSKKVRKGGVVYGHDFDDYSKSNKLYNRMCVIPAVEGWMKSYRIKPWFVITNNKNKCWMYVKE